MELLTELAIWKNRRNDKKYLKKTPYQGLSSYNKYNMNCPGINDCLRDEKAMTNH